MSDPSADHPKLRPLQPALVRHRGQEIICISDPLGFSDSKILVSPDVFFIIALCDGTRSLTDIQYEYTRRFGTLLLPSRLEKILSDLDRSLFLDNERFHQRKRRLEQEFKEATVRSASHAGQAYPADAEKLKCQLDSFFAPPQGPGHLPARKARKGVKAIIAPHIDLRAGGPCFAWAYRELARSPRPDLFIILGIGHAPMKNLFAVTTKDFDTPLGTLRTDKAFVKSLTENYPHDLLADEFAHRGEHSIEFQTVFLRYIFPEDAISIVPILCSSFDEMIAPNRQPIEDPRVHDFVQAVKIAVARSQRNVCFIAGVDLAHIGQKFGDPGPLSPSTETLLEREDREMLEHVEKADAAAFFSSLAKDNDRRRICGFPAMYVLLHLVETSRGRLLKYDKSVDPATQSIVSFASMAFD
jgi:AmmeMemoRadiSam system protein B